jgi:hypothetical protein
MLSVLSVCAVLAPSAAAQTLLDLNSLGATVFETTGPPAACGYPTGPITAFFPYIAPFVPCPIVGPVAFVPPFIGDVATNRATNTIWVTDGFIFTEYVGSGAAYGTPVRSFPLPPGLAVPGPITGMDVVLPPFAAAPMLLVTDGAFVAGIVPPPAPGCVLPAIAVPGFPLPGAGPITDLAWSPNTGSFWVCNLVGVVSNWLLPAGAPGPGGAFPVAPGPPCGLIPPLTGIAVDVSTPNAFGSPIEIYATDGVTVARFSIGGVPGPVPTFYSPLACFPAGTPPLNGIGFSLHPIAYGIGTDPTGLPVPVMAATGQSCTPSGPMTLTLAGAAPGACALFYSLGAACAPIPFLGGNLLYLTPPLFGPIGPFPEAGAFALPFAVPAGSPVGASIYLQWIVVKAGGAGFQASNGIELRIGMP